MCIVEVVVYVCRPRDLAPLQLAIVDTRGSGDTWINEHLHELGVATFVTSAEYRAMKERVLAKSIRG